MEETFKSFLFGVSDMLNHMTQLDTTGQLIKGMDIQIEESHSVSAATEEMSASILEVRCGEDYQGYSGPNQFACLECKY